MARTASRNPNAFLPVAATGAALLAAGGLLFGLWRRFAPAGTEGHEAPDLALGQPHPDASSRAPEAFRPDPTAAVPASERDALRPATMPAPTLAEQGDVVEVRWPEDVPVAPARPH
jgi:hypothetical protein